MLSNAYYDQNNGDEIDLETDTIATGFLCDASNPYKASQIIVTITTTTTFVVISDKNCYSLRPPFPRSYPHNKKKKATPQQTYHLFQ